MFRIAIVLALLLMPIAAAPEGSPQTPQIHVATRLVEVGVIVRDKNGPVANLTKNDFTVLDRGKPRQISVFSVDAAASAQRPEQPLPPNTFSDLPQYGDTTPRSVTIVLLDNLNTLYGSSPESQYEATPFWVEDMALQNAKKHLIEFIKNLDPRDRVAIYGLRDSLHIMCDFTSDRDQLLAILQNYDTTPMTNRALAEPSAQRPPVFGHAADGFENAGASFRAGIINGNREAQTMAALQQIAAHVANIPGRKNLVWLTANLPFSGAAMAHVLSPANIAVYPVDARGLLSQGFSQQPDTIGGNADADEVSGAAGHFDNAPAQSSQPVGIAAMKKLADETGGQAFVNTNDITGAIRKAVEDSAVTYTLGFYINRDDLDGKFHELTVKLNAKGLILRYPKGYFAYPDATPTKNEDQIRLMTAVQSPIESSVIPLQATLARVNQPESNSLSLSCSIDIRNLQLVQSGSVRKGAVIVYVIEQDQTGKAVQQWDRGYNFQITDAQYAALLKSGMAFRQYVHPHAGVTTLRVLVEDPSTSDLGSLIIPLAQIN
ncbi:MAG: VWA domain-containing protein [Candidatus Acidiferrales bacterium]